MDRSVAIGRRGWLRAVTALTCGATLVVTAAACGGASEPSPPEIAYGADVCAECRMIVSDPRFASAYVVRAESGRLEPRVFDDIGDMLIHASVHPDHEILAWYVHDYDSLEWIDATTAEFVHSDLLQTPMAMGIAAHGLAESARSMADEMDGETLSWSELRDRYSMSEH